MRLLRRWIVALASLATAVLVIIQLSNTWLQVNHVQLAIPNLSGELDGLRIVHITDLHGATFGAGQERLLSAIREAKPDIIAVTGDLVDGPHTSTEPLLAMFAELSKSSAVYFVSGNHDHWGYHAQLIQGLQDAGVHVLNNRAEVYGQGKAKLWMIGVDDGFTNRDDLDQATSGVGGDEPRILLSHVPDILPEAALKGIDLVLAGHHHGGQIRAPFIGALIAPGGEILPHFDSGWYRDGSTSMYLSRGLGSTGIFKFRFWNRPELVVVELAKSP